MSARSATVAIVMAKAPVPGRVKTRLCPPLSPDEAAAVAEAALSDTCEAVSRCSADRLVVALDGAPGAWLPPGFEVVPQRGTVSTSAWPQPGTTPAPPVCRWGWTRRSCSRPTSTPPSPSSTAMTLRLAWLTTGVGGSSPSGDLIRPASSVSR